jgi:hypothetical protein
VKLLGTKVSKVLLPSTNRTMCGASFRVLTTLKL